MPGNPLHIFESIGRRHIATTIGARQAIGMFPDFFVYAFSQDIQIRGGIVFNLGKKALQA
jgi:hypothetical protein